MIEERHVVSASEQGGRWTVKDLRRFAGDELHRYEIDDGVLIVSPGRAFRHLDVWLNVMNVLAERARPDLVAVPPQAEVVTDLRDDWRKTPDIVMVTRDAFQPERQEYRAADVRLVVEFSDTRQSRTRDFGEKADAYAEVGIEHYWILELPPRPMLTVFHLVDGAYEQIEASRDPIALTMPFPVEIDPGQVTAPGVRRRRSRRLGDGAGRSPGPGRGR